VETGPRVMMGETLKNGPERLMMWQTLSRRSNFQPHQLCHSGLLDACPLSSHISHSRRPPSPMASYRYTACPNSNTTNLQPLLGRGSPRGGWSSGNIGLGSVVCKIQWQCGTTDHRASLATRLTRVFRGLSNHATSHPSCLRRVFLWRRGI
jgi:hypothetical protein